MFLSSLRAAVMIDTSGAPGGGDAGTSRKERTIRLPISTSSAISP